MKVLITGFDPFGGETTNPALEAVKALPDHIGAIEIIKLEVPTVFNKSIARIEEAIEVYRPDAVLSVGQAGGRAGITLERVALNLNDARLADNEGQAFNDSPVSEDGPVAYFTTLPIKAMVEVLIKKQIPASVSYTAGTFVCNHVMYGICHVQAKKYPKMRTGFMHVPYIQIGRAHV